MKNEFKRIVKKYVLAMVILAFQFNAFSQIISEKVFINEPFASILQSSDNELIYVGTKQNPNQNENEVTLTKKDLEGKIVWQENIDMDYNCSVKDAIILSDNSIVITGSAHESTFQSIPFVLKADAKGKMIWAKYFGIGLQAEKVIETFDRGYLIAYYANGSHLMKLNGDGEFIWSKKVSDGRPHGLTETSEAVYLVVDDHNNDMILTSIGSRGEVLWKLEFGGPGIDQPVAVLNDFSIGDNYLIAGTYSSDDTGDDFYIAMIDCFGYISWTKTIGGPGTDKCFDLIQASDGDFIAVGASNSYSENGKFELYAIKVNTYGDIVWKKTFPGRENIDYHATDVFETSYGSFLLAGRELPDSRSSKEAYLFEFINPTHLNISFESDKQTFTDPPFRVEFTNKTPFADYLDFAWDFGDGQIVQSNAGTLVHEYKDKGLYDVKLTATSSDFGSMDSLVFDQFINCDVDISAFDNGNLITFSELTIYPNPVSNLATVSFDNPDDDPLSLRIINQSGRIIHEVHNIRGNTFEISRNNLPSGLHFVELSGKSNSVTKMLIE